MLTPRQQHCLSGIGIRRWLERSAIEQATPEPVFDSVADSELPSPQSAAPPPPVAVAKVVDAPQPKQAPVELKLDSWDAIVESIHQCQACELHSHCSQKVPGVGLQQADLMIIGEGPGHDEDIKGEPFVGRSGQLLDKMLKAIGITREQIFITNIVKCRPPNNRDPHVDEVKSCHQFLMAQIDAIKPKVILSVGRVSAHSLLNSSEPVGRLIQKMHQLPGSDIPVKVTYHPAYLLRTPSAKAIAWQDLKLLHQLLSR